MGFDTSNKRQSSQQDSKTDSSIKTRSHIDILTPRELKQQQRMISDLNMDQLISNRKIEVTDTEEVQDKSMKSDKDK